MISDIRSYIKSQIKAVDTDVVENPSAFYSFDIGEGLIGRSYQIEISSIVNDLRTNYREDNIDIRVSIFGYGYQEEIKEYDYLLDKATCIRDNVIDLNNFSKVGNIININSSGIIGTRLPSDDNGFKIDINFTLKRAYELEV
jgi:hypothetical protein